MISSNDFSAFALFTAGLATLTSAATVAKGDTPSGNPTIQPAVGTVVTAGSPFNVQWTPTTPGTVTIWLCKGPSTNCQNLPDPIADGIPNTGSFSWTPSTSLAPTGNSGYGLQIVVDPTGQFQYTPQFGIANSGVIASSSSATSATSASPSASSYASASDSIAVVTSCSTGDVPYPTGNSTTYAPTSYGTAVSSVDVASVSSGLPPPSSVVQPTIPMSVPPSLYTAASAPATSATSSPRPSSGAGSTGVSFGGVALGAVLAAFAL